MKLLNKIKTKYTRDILFCGVKIFSYNKLNLKSYKKYIKSKEPFFLSKCYSFKKAYHIDVVIPTTTKDLYKLERVIPSLKNINHYIDNIYIVSPASDYIKEFCQKHQLTFVDENKVLPIKLADINYSPLGISRSGWIFQQLLKLNIDTFCQNEYILVADSDTIFHRKQYFIKNGKMVFDCSDEYHKPYFDTLQKILPIKKRFSLSFVAHHMLFKKTYLSQMKKEIENNQIKQWWQIILNNLSQTETSSFSEYETYGNWMWQNHKNDMLIREWYNLSTTVNEIKNIPTCILNKHKTISMHSYNE